MTTPPNRPNLILVIASALIVLGSLVLMTLHLLANSRGRTIEQVVAARWNMPILLGVLLILGAVWLLWLMTKRSHSRPVLFSVGAITLALFGLTAAAAWISATDSRDVSVTNMVCDAEALRTSGGDPLATCESEAVDTIVHIAGVESDDLWIPDSMTDNTVSTFEDLPPGSWDASITVDGPASTTAVHIVSMNGDAGTRIGTLTPRLNSETGMQEWRGVIRVPASSDDVRALFFASNGEEAPAARIRLDVRSCHGQSIRSFDASQCETADVSAPLVQETSNQQARTWRYPISSEDGSVQVISNLEVRTYTLQPDYTTIQMLTQSTDVLIIPAAMEQIEANSITRPGESTFEIEIDASSGELIYNVYIFPTGPTYAIAAD